MILSGLSPAKNYLLRGLFILLLLTGACNSGLQKKKAENPKTILSSERNFQAGKFYPKVVCAKQPFFSYALYLPKKYNPDNHLPVVFFFDAHARGWLPVKKYHQIADSLGYMLVASNNSKNGQTSTKRNEIIYAFMADVEQRFSINSSRIYTGGFSGGARIAAGIALFNKGIAGVIGCAAGYPQISTSVMTNFPYVGIVGNKDFNFLEMISLERKMKLSHQPHQLLVYDGKHDWPPATVMKQAFLFLETEAMRRRLAPKNRFIIKQIRAKLEHEHNAVNPTTNPLAQFNADKKLVSYLNGLVPVKTYQNEMEKLSRLPSFKREKAKLENLYRLESKSQQMLAGALRTKGTPWWKKEITQLYNNEKMAKNNEAKLMNRRLLNYLSLMSYLYADANLKQGNPRGSAKFLIIYGKVDPTNPEVYFLQAKQKAMLGAPEKDILNLMQKAVQLGFNAPGRIKGLGKAAALPNSTGFQKILKQATENFQKSQHF